MSLELAAGSADAVLTVRNRSDSLVAEDLPYVFDRFYRGRALAGKAAAGSGIGLPIARWIVQRHGGSIELTSDAGRNHDGDGPASLAGKHAHADQDRASASERGAAPVAASAASG